MKSIHTKLAVAGLVLVGAISYLAYAGARSGWVYYVDVDKAASDPQYRDQRIRMHGKVSPDDFTSRPAHLSASFKLEGKSAAFKVLYSGTVPDQFAIGCDVVVEGRFDESRVFQADVLLTKCASKYASESPHPTTAGGKP